MHPRRIIPIVLALAILGGGVWWYVNRTASAASNSRIFSGTIEADEVDITSEISGKVEQLAVDEGMQVQAGDVLAVLNTDLLAAQAAQARAGVEVAEANVALLKAGSREQELAQAEAQLAQAVAVQEGAQSALNNA